MNMDPVFKEMESGYLMPKYLDLSVLFKQNLNFRFPTISLKYSSNESSFYKKSFLGKLKIILKIWSQIKVLVEEHDAFIFGNDGSIQRIFIYEARKKKKPTFIILDGIISDYSYSLKSGSHFTMDNLKYLVLNKLKIGLFKVFRNTIVSPFINSSIGASPVSMIFTIGRHSKKIIEKYKFKKTRIESTGLPRFEGLCKVTDPSFKIKNTSNKLKKDITFITSAFKWHGLNDYDQYQHKDIALIIKILNESNFPFSCNLTIKIHPRENLDDYKEYNKINFVNIVVDKDLKSLYRESDLLFSNISTCILEAGLLGIPIYSMMINFPYYKFKNSFISDNSIKKTLTCDELKMVIKEKSNNEVDENLINALTSKFVTQSNSTEVISNIICNRINGNY